MILLTRKADFSAAHYYWNDCLDAGGERARRLGSARTATGTGITTPWK
jgi:hypothetical protein